MRETLLGKLLPLLVGATLDKLIEVYRVLTGRPLPDTQQSPAPGGEGSGGAPSHQAAAPNGSCRFGLKKGQGAWVVTYEAAQAPFCDRAGMDFVYYLLNHPGKRIHSLALLARVQGEAPLQQRSSALDDADATRTHLREMGRLRGVIESDEASEAERKVAEEELAELEQFAADIHHRTFDGASKTAKGVRQAIRRVCSLLAEAKDGQGLPDPVLTAFAAHLRTHLLAPSQTGSTGHLVYEPPPGVTWA